MTKEVEDLSSFSPAARREGELQGVYISQARHSLLEMDGADGLVWAELNGFSSERMSGLNLVRPSVTGRLFLPHHQQP